MLGIVMVFLYAAIRPRFGAGPKTAAIVGIVLWIVAMMSGVADVITGFIPVSLLVLTGAWTLVEMVIAAIAGAWLYQESA